MLATVQAKLLRILLFSSEDNNTTVSSDMEISASNDTGSSISSLSSSLISLEGIQKALAGDIAIVLA